MLDWMKTLWEYNYWAHHKMLDCVAQLTEADFKQAVAYSVGSVHEQVVHVMWAEALWYARICGLPKPNYNTGDYPTIQTIRTKWDAIEADWRSYVNTMTEADLSGSFTYARGNGEPTSSLIRETLWHVVNHGTDHRAQILQLCHKYGAPTFEQDMFFYYRARNSKQK
jgi:uncharacterized damage-inducible protein DinB